MIGEQIKKFRIQKGLTQGYLGQLVGVTTQAVSKWERGGVPDAEILPNIADALGVTTDMLFGRRSVQSVEDIIFEEIFSIGREQGFQKAFDILRAVSLGLSGLKEGLSNYIQNDQYSYYSRMCIDEGIIDAKVNNDSRYFFLMPEMKDGLAKFFNNTEELAETFSVFAESNILKILFYMYSRQNTPVSLSLISAKTDIPIGKAEKLMDKLCKCRLAECNTVETENGSLKAYTFLNETVVIPLLCFAKEIRDEKFINWGIWFERNKPLF